MDQLLKTLGIVLNATLMYTPPLLFAALGSCCSEKSGYDKNREQHHN